MCGRWLLDMVTGRSFQSPPSPGSSAKQIDTTSDRVAEFAGQTSISSSQRCRLETDTDATPQVLPLRIKSDGEPSQSIPSSVEERTGKAGRVLDVPPPPTFEGGDWADTLPDSEHVRFFKSVDWGKTELGPLKDWKTALKIHTFTVMSDSRPSTLYW